MTDPKSEQRTTGIILKNSITGTVIIGVVVGAFFFVVLDPPTYDEAQRPTATESESVQPEESSGGMVVSTEALTGSGDTASVNEGAKSESERNASAVTATTPESVENVQGNQIASSTVPEQPKTEVTESVAVEPPAQVNQSPPVQDSVVTELQKGWYVQVGAFKSKVNAKLSRLKFKNINYPTYEYSMADGLIRVVIGPYSSKDEATRSKNRISSQTKAKDSIVKKFGE